MKNVPPTLKKNRQTPERFVLLALRRGCLPAVIFRRCVMDRRSFSNGVAIIGLGFVSSLALASEPPSVTVNLSDANNGKMLLSLNPPTVRAGPVVFTIKNESSSMKHELMIVPWTGAIDALPYESKTQQVDEAKLKAMEGVEDLPPGQTVTVRLTLKKGRYLAFCNEPGHYSDAMRNVFVVTGTK